MNKPLKYFLILALVIFCLVSAYFSHKDKQSIIESKPLEPETTEITEEVKTLTDQEIETEIIELKKQKAIFSGINDKEEEIKKKFIEEDEVIAEQDKEIRKLIDEIESEYE